MLPSGETGLAIAFSHCPKCSRRLVWDRVWLGFRASCRCRWDWTWTGGQTIEGARWKPE